jgi:glycosyltransferase involved in cell wall biosynthesis
MLEGTDIVCFSNDWDGDPLSKKHIVRRLARKNRILWVNSLGNRNPQASVHDFRRAWSKLTEFARGCRQVDENIFVFSPLVIPFHGSTLARRVNRTLLAWELRRVLSSLGFRNPVTWTFVPSSADVVGRLGERLIVYHCVDEFSEFAGTNRTAILEMERRLLGKSNLVIVSSGRLHETKRSYNPNTVLVTHGVDVAHFRTACYPSLPAPRDCAGLPRPVIGFFGLLAEWVDLELIRDLALARPAWSFVLIGKVQTDFSPVARLPNVRLLGRRDYADLPSYCRAFDVALLPFAVNELTLAANPLKIREYLAAGLPVVSTALPEVERFTGLVRLARSRESFLKEIEAALAHPPPRLAVSQRMDGESWDAKVEELSKLVAGALSAPGKQRPALASVAA